MSDYPPPSDGRQYPLFEDASREPFAASSAPAVDRPRLANQCWQVLELLRQGEQSNFDLIRVAQRFGARIKEIRDAGAVIEKHRGPRDGEWVYQLTKDPLGERTQP